MVTAKTLIVGAILAVGLLSSSASAQVAPAGYVFGAPGQVYAAGDAATTFHFGGGAEVRAANGLAGGAEIGFLGPTSSFADGVGVFNANGSYYFQGGTKSSRTVPFVSGGYSLLFRDGHINGWNVGGGIEYRLRTRLALRFDVRDQIHSEGGETAHFVGFRMGISFR
jgi:hypothetical protein